MIETIRKSVETYINEELTKEFDEQVQELNKRLQEKKIKLISAVALDLSSQLSVLDNGREVTIKIIRGDK